MILTKKREKVRTNYQTGTQAIQIPWQIKKRPSQHSMLGHHRDAWETPIKLRFAGGPIMAISCSGSCKTVKVGLKAIWCRYCRVVRMSCRFWS